uniref:Uncharacterized protein n=1 Tax=Cruciviridae sp. TaxID=1955495 RepID=A0A1S6LVH3_9VIRU|nr:hypothetical protein [Cruciviridae sp.]
MDIKEIPFDFSKLSIKPVSEEDTLCGHCAIVYEELFNHLEANETEWNETEENEIHAILLKICKKNHNKVN